MDRNREALLTVKFKLLTNLTLVYCLFHDDLLLNESKKILGDVCKQARNSQDCGLMKENKQGLQIIQNTERGSVWSVNIDFYKQDVNNHRSIFI